MEEIEQRVLTALKRQLLTPDAVAAAVLLTPDAVAASVYASGEGRLVSSLSEGTDLVVSTRRQCAQEQKLAILAEVDAPGSSVMQVARRHRLRSSLLFGWRRDLRKGTVPKPAVAFVPVRLPPPRATDAQGRSGIIEVVLANGRTVRVGPDVDTVVLMRIIDALETDR